MFTYLCVVKCLNTSSHSHSSESCIVYQRKLSLLLVALWITCSLSALYSSCGSHLALVFAFVLLLMPPHLYICAYSKHCKRPKSIVRTMLYDHAKYREYDCCELIMSSDPSLWTHQSLHASVRSLSSASGLWDPGQPHVRYSVTGRLRHNRILRKMGSTLGWTWVIVPLGTRLLMLAHTKTNLMMNLILQEMMTRF